MAKILIVDDQESILKTVESVLKRAGHEVTLAKDGYVALEKIALFDYDMIVTDAMMPGISGYDLIKSLRINEKTRHLPIMMLTSKNGRRDIEKAIQVKVDHFLIKPIEPEALLAKVAGLLARSSAAAKPREIPVSEDAGVKLASKITGISEQGLTLTCFHAFPVGARLPLYSPLFDKIKIAGQELRVIQCQPQGQGFVVRTQFANMSKSDQDKLQTWLSRQAQSKAS